jgi:hypothetical protein
MSAAALYTVPHSIPPLTASSMVPAPSLSNRRYSSPTRENYANQQNPVAPAPSPYARRPTANNNNNNTHRKNTDDTPASPGSQMSSRPAVGSPVPVSGASLEFQPSPSERRRNSSMARVAPMPMTERRIRPEECLPRLGERITASRPTRLSARAPAVAGPIRPRNRQQDLAVTVMEDHQPRQRQ